MIAAVLLTLAVSATALMRADIPKLHTKSKSETPSERNYATGDLDTSVSSLPAGYNGHDISALFGAHTAAKGEFETTDEFEARSALRSGVYSFRLENVQPKYNADAHKFEIIVNGEYPTFGHGDIDTEHAAYSVRHVELSRHTYPASNSFGASTLVTSITNKEYLIVTRRVMSLDDQIAGRSSPHLVVPVARAEAPKLKGRIAVLLVCRLDRESRPDPVETRSGSLAGATGIMYAEPTITRPTEVLEYQFALRADILAFWVYDHGSGRILGRFDAEGNPSSVDTAEESTPDSSQRAERLESAGEEPARSAPLRVEGDVKAPIVISRVEPIYPEVARMARISGVVILECVIDKEGRITNVAVLKPLPFGLDGAAVNAVKQWTFKPGTLNGRPVDVIFNVTVNMKLPSDR